MSRAVTGPIGLALTLIALGIALGIAFAGVSHAATVSLFPDVAGFTTVSPASAGTFAGMTVRHPDEPTSTA